MMRNAAVFLVTTLMALQISGKTFTRCDLYRELKQQGFPESQMRDWICLVEAESSGRTEAVGGPDDDGSYDHGLFQINDRYWCSADNTPGKGCRVACADLRTDDITKAAQCTKQIYSQQGFGAWVGWVNECRGRLLPDISECQITDNYYYYREYFKYVPRFKRKTRDPNV